MAASPRQYLFTSESVTEGHPDKIADQISDGVLDAVLAQDPSDDDELDIAGAGDQGMMFGYASNETPELMPLPISVAHRLAKRLSQVRKDGSLDYLRPDGKTQVSVRYVDGRPVAIEKLLISSQHAEGAETRIRDDLWEHVVVPVLPADLYDSDELRRAFLVNPTGRFVIGGPVDRAMESQALAEGRGAHYQPTAAYGHFGREGEGFTWERTDVAAALCDAAGLAEVMV